LFNEELPDFNVSPPPESPVVAFEVDRLVWVRLAGYVLIIGKQNVHTEFFYVVTSS
jgi:hypothetical protein